MDSKCIVATLTCTGNRHLLPDAKDRRGSGEGYPSICSTHYICLSHVCTSPSQLFWWVQLSSLNSLAVIHVFMSLILNLLYSLVCSPIHHQTGQDGALGIATGLWTGHPRNCGFIPDRDKRLFPCSQHLYWLWHSLSLLWNEYQGFFPRGYSIWGVKLTTDLHHRVAHEMIQRLIY